MENILIIKQIVADYTNCFFTLACNLIELKKNLSDIPKNDVHENRRTRIHDEMPLGEIRNE